MLSGQKDKKATFKRDIFFLLIILGGLFFILLGSRPLFVPDEGRYAEIAREMVALKDYVTPYLNHIKYFEKPILFYWLEAAAIKLTGLNIWSLRSVNALLGLLGCLMTYVFARHFYGRTTGLLAALILATSTLYFVMARMITLDLPVTVFLMGCLYAALLGLLETSSSLRRIYCWSASSFAALAVLTKGLIGIVFPILIISGWLTVTGKWDKLKQLFIPSCIMIFFIIVLPWHVLVAMRHHEFFYFYFINQHFLRYTHSSIGHYQPNWFFIPYLIMGFFPWIVFLPQAIFSFCKWSKRKNFLTEIYLLIWALIIFTFFSFSKSKLIPYLLPVFPPLAILVARYLQLTMSSKNTTGIKIGAILLLFSSITIFIMFHFFLKYTLLPHPFIAKHLLYTAASVLLIGSLLNIFYIKYYLRMNFSIMFITTGLFLLVTMAALPAIDARTIFPLTQILKPLLTPESEVITFNKYYQDLPFYLQRRISVLNWENELSYGMQHQNTREWMIDNHTFWQRWHHEARIFSIISLTDYQKLKRNYPQEKLFLLGKTINNALISNRE